MFGSENQIFGRGEILRSANGANHEFVLNLLSEVF